MSTKKFIQQLTASPWQVTVEQPDAIFSNVRLIHNGRCTGNQTMRPRNALPLLNKIRIADWKNPFADSDLRFWDWFHAYVEPYSGFKKRIFDEYETDYLEDIFAKAARARSGSPHEESFREGEPYCAICGTLITDFPDPIFHPEQYLA